MKKSTFRAIPGRGGFIRTTLAPIHDRRDARFSMMDMTVLTLVVVGALAAVRFLVGH